MNKIAITGATSMLGVALTQEALAQGIKVVAIARKDSKSLYKLSPSCDIEYASLDSYKDFSPKTHDCDAFFHLAWGSTFAYDRDQLYSQINNIRYTLDAIALAKKMGAKAFVGAGSQAEYGIATAPLNLKTPIDPQSGYGMAKFCAGKMANLMCKQLGIKCNWLRIVSTYGISQKSSAIIPTLIEAFEKNTCPPLTKCEQIWDFMYDKDCARAMLAVAQKGIEGKTYIIGSGVAKPLHDFVKITRDIINPNVKLEFGTKEYYPHQPMYLVADTKDLQNDLQFTAKTSFEEGIRLIKEHRGHI